MNAQLDPSICNKFSSPDYMAFCHENFGCLVESPECFGKLNFHHVEYRSHEGSDLDGVMLCDGHHTEGPYAFHRITEEAFCERYGIESGQAQRVMLHMYIESLGAGGRPNIKPQPRKLARGKNLQPSTRRVGTPDNPLI